MKHIAIITARGGSKRIPKKNIKDFCGKPIIAYSIEAALTSGIYDEVMVSTDSEEIAAVARQYGAAVPFLRSEATSNDFATTRDVLVEVLETYAAQGERFDMMTCLYPTAPFITAEKLIDATRRMQESDADALMPVVAYSFPPQRAMVIRDGCLEYQYPEHRLTRSQDLEPIYHDCGQFYVYRVAPFLDAAVGSGKIVPLPTPEEETQDIDNLSDWVLAEMKYRRFVDAGAENE